MELGYLVVVRVAPPPLDPLESAEIMSRPAEKGQVWVQHVLIGWKDAPAVAQGAGSPEAKNRSKADADKLAKDIFDQAKGGADFKALMKKYSEDPGSKDSGEPYPVDAKSQMVPTFKKLSLRLKEGEVGMVISEFGWHVIKRIPPPPPPPADSLESTDILKRDPVTQAAKVKHILLGWTEVHASDPRGVKRTRAELEKLVKDTVAKLKSGAKIEPLMKELSEDPGSADDGKSYDVSPDASLVEPFKNLSLRLKVGEVGVVKTQFGIHIIQRVE
jgi:parvulin-like peptidyl-prolyl isomerase